MGAVELPVTLQVQTKHTLLRPKLFVVNVLTVALYQYVNCVQEKMWWFPFESFADWNEDPDFCVRTAEVKPDRGSFGEAFSRPGRRRRAAGPFWFKPLCPQFHISLCYDLFSRGCKGAVWTNLMKTINSTMQFCLALSSHWLVNCCFWWISELPCVFVFFNLNIFGKCQAV